MAEQVDRFRSFLERYVIARASHFEVGREQEQAWLAIQDGKKVYGMVADAKNDTDKPDQLDPYAQLAQVAQLTAAPPPGTAGPVRMPARPSPKRRGFSLPW